jgi:MarR family transcriptional regulator, organic hydroperoxide resistance regulator
MWDTTRGFLRHFSRRISQHGVNFGQWPFLRVLWAEDGITQAQLAARVRMRSPTTVAAVDWLERNGFVRRRAHPEDLRKINVFLTPKGRRIYPKLAPEIRYVNERAAKGLSARELAQLKALLGRLRSNLDEPPELPRRR